MERKWGTHAVVFTSPILLLPWINLLISFALIQDQYLDSFLKKLSAGHNRAILLLLLLLISHLNSRSTVLATLLIALTNTPVRK